MTKLQNQGVEFMSFIEVSEDQIDQYEPVRGSYAIINCQGKLLICYNIWRKQWEFPAGSREGEETPKDCAKRELYEETGQEVKDLTIKGLLKSKVVKSGAVKCNPVFYGELEELQSFKPNDETSNIMLWDGLEPIDSFDSLDIRIIDYI
ncbi:NUDIX hydrolase [Alkalibacillus haloalkaliphilus]|uniref:NUDIX hydrolase n=1 Tax=Alkalibacillus haloalkaliphilus TaxID=94136 RepID=UPI002935394D|nr:NUDIX hydrolase [Alkalibacillus haloalkaliphilus]MDV2581788.1 NUDIX hydrolase [Alkalibacillus haloalkaliphilus]